MDSAGHPRGPAGRRAEGAAVGAAGHRYIWWNFAAITLDVSFWTAGSACVDVGAVLPVFVNTLTASKLVIAVLTALPSVGWTLPQLVGAARILHRPRKKRYLLTVAALGRTPMLALPVLLLLFPLPSKAVMLWAMVACYTTLFFTDGLIGAAWYDIIAKTIPPRLRGRFFGAMNVLGGFAAIGSGWLVKRVLASPSLAYPRQYGVLFACLCAGLFLSYLLLAMIREPEGEVMADEPQPLGAVLRHVPRIWHDNAPLRRLLAVSWLASLSTLAWPFYVLYGIQALGLAPEAGAVFIWAGAVGNMAGSAVWAWVNDRRGPRAVLVAACSLRAAPPAVALAVPLVLASLPSLRSAGTAQYLFALVFLFGGAATSGGMMGFTNYVLELAPERERPVYVGMGNTLNAPGLLAPVLGGWLISILSYQAVFALAVVAGVVSLVVGLRLPVAAVAKAHAPARPAPEVDIAPG